MLGFIGYYIWRNKRGYGPGPHKAAGVARVVAYALGIGAVAAAGAAHSAMADVREASRAFSKELAPLSDLIGETSQVRLNGQSIFLGNTLVNDSVEHVLDRFEQQCHENRAGSAEVWAKVANVKDLVGRASEADLAKLPQGAGVLFEKMLHLPVDRFGTYRDGNEQGGLVMCFVKSDGSPTDAKTAWSEFNKTGDLGKVGNLRYAAATRTPSHKVRVTAAWTEEHFNFNSLTARTSEDAPGDDSTSIARPPSSRRVFAASVQGTPYSVRIYESTKMPAEILSFYDAKMEADGWNIIHPSDATGLKDRGYQKGSVMIALSTQHSEDITHVTLGEMGVPGT